MEVDKVGFGNETTDDKRGFIIIEATSPTDGKSNSISTTAYVFSIIIAVVGGIAGVILLFENVLTGIMVIVSAFVSWLLFISLSEIIRLLNNINKNTSKNKKYIVKSVTNVTSTEGISEIVQKANICSSLNSDTAKAKELYEQGLISEEDYHRIIGE